MSLIFASVIPCHPLIAKEALQTEKQHTPLSHTAQALFELEGELYFMKPDTILLLATAEDFQLSVVTLNVTALHASDGRTIPNDIGFAAHVKEVCDTASYSPSLQLVADGSMTPEIESTVNVLQQHLPHAAVLFMTVPAQLHTEQAKQLGEILRLEIVQTNKRIAVIVASHLASCATQPEVGHAVDALLLRSLSERTPKTLSDVQQRFHSGTGIQTSALQLLLYLLEPQTVTCDLASYEQLHDHGQLVLNFVLQ